MEATSSPAPGAGSGGRRKAWLAASLALVAIVVLVAVIVLSGDDESTAPADLPDSPDDTVASTLTVEDGSIPGSTTEAVDATIASTSPTSTVTPRSTSTLAPRPTSTVAPPSTSVTTPADVGGTSPIATTTTPATGETPTTTGPGGSLPDAWTVTAIVTGDTLDLVGPEGSWTVGLLGVIAPTDGQCYADQAIDALASLVDGPLVLVKDGQDEDDSGRKLRYVETTDGEDVGAQMILQGAAFADPTRTDFTRWQGYAQRQVQAENDSVGMWEPGRCSSGEPG